MARSLFFLSLLISVSAFAALDPANDKTGCIVGNNPNPVLTGGCVAVQNSSNGWTHMKCIGGSTWSGQVGADGCNNSGNMPSAPMGAFYIKSNGGKQIRNR